MARFVLHKRKFSIIERLDKILMAIGTSISFGCILCVDSTVQGGSYDTFQPLTVWINDICNDIESAIKGYFYYYQIEE